MQRLLLVVAALLLSGCFGSGLERAQKGGKGEDLLGILVTPETVVLPVGHSVQLVATGLYDGRRSEDLTHVVRWRTGDDAIAEVGNGLDEEGLLTGVDVGSVEVWAKLDDVKSVPVVVTVTDQAIDALIVEPSELVVEVGQEVELTATARFTDGTLSDATGQVRWITADGAVATLDEGVLTAVGAGSTEITAVWDALESKPVPVEVLAEASPDLRVATLVPYPGDDTLTLTVDVENLGDIGASGFWVDVFVDPKNTPGPGDIGDGFARVSYVGPGAEKSVTIDIDGLDAGSHEVLVVIDIEDEVAESDEGNNEADTTVSLDGASLPPNLVVDYWGYLADPYYVYHYVEVANYGDDPAGPFWVDLYLDRVSAPGIGVDGDEFVQVPALGPWEVVVVEFFVEASCNDCWSWIQVDSLDDVAESAEWDNVAGPGIVSY